MRLRILGLGNLLQGDDGLGPEVLARLGRAGGLPPEVELRDLGTPGPELWQHLAGAGAVILVDAVLAPGSPGSLVRMEGQDLLQPASGPRLGAHAPALHAALAAAELRGGAPRRLVLWGAVPFRRSLGLGLSAPVASALPRLVAAVRSEAERLLSVAARDAISTSPRAGTRPREGLR